MILTLPAIGALRLAFPRARIAMMGDAKRLCLARHPAYVDELADAETWDIYRLFGHEPRVPQQLATYLARFDLILSYLPAPDAAFTDNLKQYCPGEIITWPPHPSAGVHVTDHLMEPVLRYANQSLSAEPRVFAVYRAPARR